MKYLIVRYVDSVTGIPSNIFPCKNGPSFPKIKGLKFEFSNPKR